MDIEDEVQPFQCKKDSIIQQKQAQFVIQKFYRIADKIVLLHYYLPHSPYGYFKQIINNSLSMDDTNILSDFKLIKKLGSGAFGQVFMALSIRTNSEVAVKLEPVGTKSPQLFYQAKILKTLEGSDATTDFGIPRVYYCGNQQDYNIMVMDLLGQSLQDLYVTIGRKFDLKTTLMIGYQMVERIQYIHSKGFIHRDMKPDNFMIGRGKKSNKIFIIDFGLAKKYLNKDGSHIPYRDNKNLTGTARYTSLNTHLGIEQGRRDDLQGMVNVLLYFVKGSLPWQNLKANGKKEKYEKIMQRKLTIPLDNLCAGLPNQFQQLIQYSRSLEFEEQPDYAFLKGLFMNVMQRQKYEMDYNYCWQRI